MKIAVYSIPEINLGKYNVKDPRLDQVHKITGSKKKTYVQVELTGEDSALEADLILVTRDSSSDVILRDLEFVETRLSRAEDDQEKVLLGKLKSILEKEQFICSVEFSGSQKDLIVNYGLLSSRPVKVIDKTASEDIDAVLLESLREGGYISFFTTGEKETRAWLIKNGATAWEAAGQIHSDIQQGFIRAEIISLADFLEHQGEVGAKRAGKMRLEQKDYIMQDADLTVFRFSK